MKKESIVSIFSICLVLLIVGSLIFYSDNTKYLNDIKYSGHDDNNNTSLLFVGDIMLGRNVGDEPFKYVKTLVGSADIASGNLEYAITDSKIPADKKITIKADCQKSSQLKNVGFDILALANNHVMDFGEEGLGDTIDCLKRLDIEYVGAGENKTEAKKLKIIAVDNLRIGFLSFTSISPEEAYATNTKSGVSDIRDNIEDYIKDVKAKNRINFLVVDTHWGKEYNLYPSDFQIKTAREIIDSGADVVVGHHPHVEQPYEKYKGKYIFYSLGNFVFDQEHDVTKNSFVVRMFLDEQGNIVNVEKIDLRISDSSPFIVKKVII